MTKLINKRELRKMIPLCSRTIDAMEKEGKFPKRIVLTVRQVAWDESEVLAWIEKRRASGDVAKRPGWRKEPIAT